MSTTMDHGMEVSFPLGVNDEHGSGFPIFFNLYGNKLTFTRVDKKGRGGIARLFDLRREGDTYILEVKDDRIQVIDK